MKVFLIVLGVLSILSSFTVILTDPLTGVICIALGILFIILGIKRKPRKKDNNSNGFDLPKNNSSSDPFNVNALIDKEKIKTQRNINAIPKYDIDIDKNNVLERKFLKDMSEIKFRNVTKSFNINSIPAYVVIDVETTGLKPASDRIIELSAILYEDNEPSSYFSTRINPGKSIPVEASAINNIYDADVQNSPTLESVSASFLEFVGNCPVVAYNAGFDLKFLYCSGIDLTKHMLFDAYALAKKAYPDSYNYKLEVIANDECGLYFDAHSSLADCYATGIVFQDELRTITIY